MKKTKKIVFLAFAMLFLYGCAEVALIGIGAGAGVAGYKYIEGNVSRDYPLVYSKAWDTTNTALNNLKMIISTSENNDNKGTIKALQKDGTIATIKLKERGPWVTTISVKAGAFGNSADAEKILDEINSAAGL